MSIAAYCRRPVCTVGPDETLRDAALRMEKEGVGLLVVSEDDEALGVLTDRDVALHAGADGREAAAAPVRDAMSRPPVAIPADASLTDAAARLASSRLRRLAVTEGERVTGVVSADDLVRLLASEIGGLGEVLVAQLPAGASRAVRREAPGAEPARAVRHYQGEVVTAPAEAPVARLVDAMEEQAVGSVVILGEGARAVGLVTDRDLALRVVAAGRDPETTPASAIMTTPLVSADPAEPLEEVVARMRSAGVRRIPVLSDGRPTGIVTFDDVLVTLGRELHQIGEGVAREVRAARLRSYSEWVRAELEERLEEAAGTLRQLGDQALRGVVREVEGAFDRMAGSARRAAGRAGRGGRRVADLMAQDVGTCRVDDAASQAARVMWERDCGLVPVVEPDGAASRVVGVVTDRDLCMAAYTQGRRMAEIPVREVMSSGVHSCRAEDDLAEAESLMRAAQVRRLPVLDAEGRLQGILSLADLAEAGAVSASEVAETLGAICRPRREPATPA